MVSDSLQKLRTYIIHRICQPSILAQDTLLYWRSTILISILLTGLVLGSIAFASAIFLIFKKHVWILAISDGLGFLICLSLLSLRGLSYENRAAATCVLCYLIGLGIIFSVGPISGGPIWLFTFAVLVGVLLGSKAAILAVIINGLTISMIFGLIYTRRIGEAFPFFDSPQAMVSACVNFIVLNIVTAVSVSVLVKGLVSSHQNEKTLIKSLAVEVEERRHAEKAVRESEEKYRLLADNVTDIIWLMDINTLRLTYISPSVEKNRGYTPEEAISQSLEEWLTPESYEKAVKILSDEIIKDNEMDPDRFVTIELEQYKRDRSTTWTEVIASFVRDNEQRPTSVLGVTRDITERKEAQQALREKDEKLIRSKKMESIALMAGGIAHDLNNILSGIASYPDLLLMDLPAGSALRKPLEVIRDSGQRASAVVADLITVARGIATSKEVLNLNFVVKEYMDSAEQQYIKTMNPTSSFKSALDPDLLNIKGSESHIKKSIMNLVLNASEALKEDGTIYISTKNIYLDSPLKGYSEVRIGEYAVLTIEDNGIGISPNHLDRIFEPFYTKKIMGRSGTGLGLAVVWNAVQAHDGYINVMSSESGSKFELYFPATREEADLKKNQVDIATYMGHGEKILVVDDEESQRVISCDLLTRLGYTTEAVSSGEKAIEYLKGNSADLMVLDMLMPKGMSGRETYEQVIKFHPTQKTVICSGYAEMEDIKRAQKLGAGKFLRKPYTIEKLAVAVQNELKK